MASWQLELHSRRARQLLGTLTILGLLVTFGSEAGGGAVVDLASTDNARPDADTSPTTYDAATRGDLAVDQVLRMRLAALPSSLDPAFVDRGDAELLAYNIYNALVRYDHDGEFLPDLAESWETNEDLTQWTFKLREGITFHHGYGELTAGDVVFSYDRISAPETAAFQSLAFANVKSIEALDDYTVRFNLTAPDSSFLHSVANFQQGGVISRAAFEELGDDYGTNPIGTGPFAIETYDHGNGRIVLVRNDQYFEGPATLSQVQLTVVDDNEAAAIALETGEFDVAMDITGETRLLQLQEAGFVLHQSEPRATTITMLNPDTQPAFSDPRVRRAFAHAIDYNTIVDTLVPFREDRAINIFPRTLPEYTDDVPTYDYDPELARELLAEAGYADGLTVTRLIRGTDGVEDRDLLEQEYLAAVGVTQEFETVEVSEFSERRFEGDFQMATRSVNEANIDFIATALLHPESFPPAGLNGSYYDNPEVTALIEEGRASLDPEVRTAIYHEIQQLVMEDLPYLPEGTLTFVWPSWDYVEGIDLNPQALLDFHGVSIRAHD